jgi:hypothetical protein
MSLARVSERRSEKRVARVAWSQNLNSEGRKKGRSEVGQPRTV